MIGNNSQTVARRDYNRIFSTLALRFFLGVLLTTLCLRDYLFGNGLYLYRDWTWPLSTGITPVANFSPDIIRNVGPDPLGFVRMFFTWPVVIIDGLTTNPILAEKVYIVYLFSIFMFFIFVFAELLLRVVVRETSFNPAPWKREVFVLSTVLFCVTNFWSLQQLSDLYFTYLIEFALIGISIALVFLENDWLRKVVLPGALLSLCVFLDPNLYPFGLIAVTVALVSTSIQRSSLFKGFLKGIARTTSVFLTSLPAILTMLFVLTISTGTNLRDPSTYQFSTVNLSLINSLRLLGYWWSTIAYAPPSLLWNGNPVSEISSMGSPSYILLPAGPSTILWVLSTLFVPVFAFGSTFASHLRRLTVPLSIVAILGLLLTQPSIFPYPYVLANQLKDIPGIGGALVTVLAIPDHALVLVALSYAFLVSAGFFSLLASDIDGKISRILRKVSRLNIYPKHGHDIGRTLSVGIVMLLLVFQGWQFFSGSLYPSGYVWGAAGNGISNVGAFTPSIPPPEMFQVYNWLVSQKSDFNIYWPGASGASYPWSEKATGPIASQESPKPTIFPRALPYLLGSNLIADVHDYLAALNIRYLVVQPFSKVAMEFSWGVGNVDTLNQVLAKTPGISLLYSSGDITVYQVNGLWGNVYSSNLVASHNSSDLAYATAYAVFASLGTRIALFNSPTSSADLCFDYSNCQLAILSPSNLGLLSSANRSLVALNDTSVFWPTFLLQNYRSITLPKPWALWLANNWGPGNSTIGIQNGSVQWTFGGTPTYLTLSYNGTVTGGNPGGIALPRGSTAVTQIGFWYRTSSMFNGSVQVVIPLLNRTGAVSREIVSPTQSVSNDWKHVSFNTTLPADAGFFTARFVAQGTDGWVQMRNIELNFTLLEEDPSSLFGTVVPISGGNLSLRGFHGYPFIQFEGNGSLRANDQTTNLLSPNTLSWRALPGPFDSPSVLSGNVNVSAIMVSRAPFTLGSFNSNQPEDSTQESIKVESPSTVVFSRPFAPGYRLGSPDKTLSPRASIDGLTLFSDVPPGTYAVSFPPINVARAGYIISLGFIFGIITLSTVKHFRGNLSRRRLIGCNASNLPATATFPLD